MGDAGLNLAYNLAKQAQKAGRGEGVITMFRKGFSAALLGAAALAVVARCLPRRKQSRVQVGQLACSLSAGVGMIVGSQRNVNCTFQPDNGPPEAYTGHHDQ